MMADLNSGCLLRRSAVFVASKSRLHLARFLMLGLCITMCGCGGPGPPPTYPVQGTVTLDGEPLEEGEVFFHDVAKIVDSDHAYIVDGAFSFRSKEGRKRVEITAVKQVGVTEVPGRPDKSGAPILESLVPPKYNIQSKLEVDVGPSSDNEFTFDLKSK